MGFMDIFKINKIKSENDILQKQITILQNQISNINGQINNLQVENSYLYDELKDYKTKFEEYKLKYEELSSTVSGEQQESIKREIDSLNDEKIKIQNELNIIIEEYNTEKDKIEKKLLSEKLKVKSLNTVRKAIQNAVNSDEDYIDISDVDIDIKSLIKDVEELHLNCLDVPSLRKLLTANKANIQLVIEKYEARYNTKSNKAIYQLMVLALESELQNVLLNLKFGSLDKAQIKIMELLNKYFEIVSNGNQSIAPTVKKFILELQILYLDTINIEYEYYIQRERIKEEQRALKEQMRQEAEERKILAQQQKQIEKEEQKYTNEIESVKTALSYSNNEETEKLKKRLEELESLLMQVKDKKEEIVNLQNGQAGHVYVISNIGSFGNNVFKVGMTRRLDPQERVDELGNASVPFPFDVHSLIFSENAVELENNLHKILDEKRVNKVNKRKEFFAIDISELENIIHKIDPSAEFKMTALAEQYNQSLELSER